MKQVPHRILAGGLSLTLLAPVLRAQSDDAAAVRQVVEAVAALTQAGDLAGLDTIYAHERWVHIIENTGVNHGWPDYRDNHLKPELAVAENFRYRFYGVEPQVRGNVAWASFRYEVSADLPQRQVAAEGRGTAVLEKRGERWVVVHLHTAGRPKNER